MLHPSEIRCTLSDLRCTLKLCCTLRVKLRPSELRCILLSYAAPYWTTPHPKWAMRHPKIYCPLSISASLILPTKLMIYRETFPPKYHRTKNNLIVSSDIICSRSENSLQLSRRISGGFRTKVGNLRQKNNSAENGTNGYFQRNPGCST